MIQKKLALTRTKLQLPTSPTYIEFLIRYSLEDNNGSIRNHIEQDDFKYYVNDIKTYVFMPIQTKQEYSFFNHLRWYFTNKPFTTGIVGGDKLPENINSQIAKGPYYHNQDDDISKKVINLISDTDKKYKKIIEDNFSGNKIVILIKKEK